MQSVYIPDAHNACLKCFFDDSRRAERAYKIIRERQKEAAKAIFNHVLGGGACEMQDGLNMKILTKSIRAENCVAISNFCLLRGDWIATSHHDSFSSADLCANIYTGKTVFLQ